MTYFQHFSKVDADYPIPNDQNLSFLNLYSGTNHSILDTVGTGTNSAFSGKPSTPFEVVFQAHLNRVNNI